MAPKTSTFYIDQMEKATAQFEALEYVLQLPIERFRHRRWAESMLQTVECQIEQYSMYGQDLDDLQRLAAMERTNEKLLELEGDLR